MALSESIIASTIANMIGTGYLQLARQVSVGSFRARGKKNDIYINVSRGFPPGAERAEGFMREFIESHGFSFDLWMKPWGFWQHKISSPGIILTAELWIRGPLCSNCHSEKFTKKRIGWLVKKDVQVCDNCDAKFRYLDDMTKPARDVGKRVQRMIVASLGA